MARFFHRIGTTVLVLLTTFGFASSARAQGSDGTQPPATPPSPTTGAPTPRGVAEFSAGTAFGNTEAHLAFTGRIGVALGPHLQVAAEFGRFDNIVTKSLHDDVRDTSAILSGTYGAPVAPTSTVAADYGLGTVRLLRDLSPRVGVFLDAGVGVAMVRPQVAASADGVDLTSQVLSALTQTVPESENSISWVAGGGFTVRTVGRATVDAGYRFGRIGTSQALNTNTLYGGWTMRW
jgi:opacity protein-like surface antigen